MARIAIQKSNFTSGELKPQLHAREDLAAYQNGARKIENRVPLPEGGTIRRSGTRMVMPLLDQTNIGKLIPFKFSRTDARILVLSDGVATVCYSGGGIIQSGMANYTFAIPAAWTPAVYPNIRWTESADVIFVADGVEQPNVITRISDTDWTITPYANINGPTRTQNTDITKTIIASGVSGSVTLTANFAAFQAGHVGSIWRLDEANLGSIPYWTADENIAVNNSPATPSCYRRNAGAVYCAYLPSNGYTLTSAAIASGGAGYVSGDVGKVVGLVGATSAAVEITSVSGGGAVTAITISTPGLTPSTPANPVATAGGTTGAGLTLTAGWTQNFPAPGSYPSGVNAPTQLYGDQLSQPNGVTWHFLYQDFGYVQITAYTDSMHVTATVLGVGETAQTVLPDSLSSSSPGIVPSATYRWSEGAWSAYRGFPNLTAYDQERIGWLRAYEFWLTYSGDDYSFLVDTTDAAAISGGLLSIDGTMLQPQWTFSSGWVVVGCADSEPVIRGPDMFDALTQSNVLAVVDKGQGSAWHIPAVVDAAVVNIGVSRQRLHYTKINRLIDTINVDEISVNSNHVLRGLAAGVAYQHDPNRVIWGYSQNGDLWSYTFRPDQQVVAAARHPMPNAFVEDICAIPTADGMGAEIWMIVRRVINNVTKRFVEVMEPFFQSLDPQAPTAVGAWYVDCALPYSGGQTQTLSGLTHLEGATARVFSNGMWLGDYVVDDTGAITLPTGLAAQNGAIAGLPICARLRTLPLDPTRPGSTTRGDVKQATHSAADFFETFGGDASSYSLDNEGNWQAGDGVEGLFPSGSLNSWPYPVPLFTGRKSFPMDGPHGVRIELEIIDDHPYPSSILALAPDVQDGEA